jgi:branched-chain amino acid transport system ATP-binding protein
MAEFILSGRGLTKRFGGLVAVRDVDIDVRRGEIFGLIGPNGAGKSTLFRLIAGIMHPSAGEVTFEGTRISGRRTYDVCRMGVAATHQIVRPFRNLSVLDNVMVGAFFGRRPAAVARAGAQVRASVARDLRVSREGAHAGSHAQPLRSEAARDRPRARDRAAGAAAR